MPKDKNSIPKQTEVYVVSVDMGYGHQRATYPLQHLARNGTIIHADSYKGIPEQDKEIWLSSRKAYETVSRFKKVPLVGSVVWNIFDKFQEIKDFYPRRDLSRPSLQLWSTVNMMRSKAWGKHFIEMLEQKPLPLVTSFFVPAYMAEEFNYSEDIYLIVCDADVSRAWAAYNPKKSRIKYLVPSRRVYERLQEYGVPERMIYYTGFPLPKENIGVEDSEILKGDLVNRVKHLDPEEKYCHKYCQLLQDEFDVDIRAQKPTGLLTLTFAVGGAGAQRELGIAIVKSLRGKLLTNQIKLNLIAGTHDYIYDYFKNEIQRLGLSKELGNSISIVYADDKYEYFKAFNDTIRTTDILWTKPSELSFYSAFGLPIIMSDPIGSQEHFNRKWLLAIGAGVDQENVKYTDEWLFDWLRSGWFAESAMHGYFEAAKYGTFNIEKILAHNEGQAREPELVLQY